MKKILIICSFYFLTVGAAADKNKDTDNEELAAACVHFAELYKYQSCLVKKGEEACTELLPDPLKLVLTNPPKLANAYIESFKVKTAFKCAAICKPSLNEQETKDCLEKKQTSQECILAEIKNVLENKCAVGKKPIENKCEIGKESIENKCEIGKKVKRQGIWKPRMGRRGRML